MHEKAENLACGPQVFRPPCGLPAVHELSGKFTCIYTSKTAARTIYLNTVIAVTRHWYAMFLKTFFFEISKLYHKNSSENFLQMQKSMFRSAKIELFCSSTISHHNGCSYRNIEWMVNVQTVFFQEPYCSILPPFAFGQEIFGRFSVILQRFLLWFLN